MSRHSPLLCSVSQGSSVPLAISSASGYAAVADSTFASQGADSVSVVDIRRGCTPDDLVLHTKAVDH
jgi:hypothetical protein